MQTLSRYFVAFLLLLVSSFLDESKSEKEPQQASLEKVEIILEESSPTKLHEQSLYRCS